MNWTNAMTLNFQESTIPKKTNLARTHKQDKEPRIPFWVVQFIKKPQKSKQELPQKVQESPVQQRQKKNRAQVPKTTNLARTHQQDKELGIPFWVIQFIKKHNKKFLV